MTAIESPPQHEQSADLEPLNPAPAFRSTSVEPLVEESTSAPPARAKRAWYWRWIDSPLALLAILFLVTGAFGLPLLYHSRAFSTRMKWLVGAVNVVYTALSCYWAYLEVARSVATIREVMSAM